MLPIINGSHMSPAWFSARDLAFKAHQGQYRRDRVTPYIIHPAAVVDRLMHKSDIHQIAGWLHDVLEDGPGMCVNDLRAADIPNSAINVVLLLTHTKGGNYNDYIRALKLDSFARDVKVADILCNLSDNPTAKQIQKYVAALDILALH